ncbi:MAG: DNA mismatch endonuclease Vsr [Gammaproteobacteria bacterium]|nr:DNA mismatch endonuclease Vsr [Gammaproteobacteria bacterium]
MAARDLCTTIETSVRMSRVRQRATGPECVVRRILSELGHHYRTCNRDLPGSPDLANRRRRWAIFVHGCFWHAHPECNRATVPKSNRSFWLAKFKRNRERDRSAARELRRSGYRVITIWECQTTNDVRLQSRLRLVLGG